MSEENLRTQRIMPDFSHSFYGFRHTVDSALEVLSTLEVPAERITLRLAVRGMPSRLVAEQAPPPGELLHEDSLITLSVAGLGFCRLLPVAMQDSGGEQAPGTKEVFELLNAPVLKVTHWVHEGARLFDIATDNR